MALSKLSSGAEMKHSDFLFYGATKVAPLVSFVCLFVSFFRFLGRIAKSSIPTIPSITK